MINASYGESLMNAIATGGAVQFPSAYIGLFKKMPDAQGSGGAETFYPEYHRVSLTANGLNGKKLIGNATGENKSETIGEGENARTVVWRESFIKNQEIIYFPENETGEADPASGEDKLPWVAVGVGLFSSKSGGTPFLWAEFTDENGKPKPVTIPVNSSPMFRIDKFKWFVK